MDTAWQPIETAPKDGRQVELTWMENGEPQEVWRMAWNPSGGNLLVQDGLGIWEARSLDGVVVVTWTQEEGGPTHWREPRRPTH